MPELLPYFFIGMITGIGITGVLGAIKLMRWQRTAAELESQLRSHSFELQIALEELAEKTSYCSNKPKLMPFPVYLTAPILTGR